MDILTRAYLEENLQMSVYENDNIIVFNKQWYNVVWVIQQHKATQQPKNKYSLYIQQENQQLEIGHEFEITDIIKILDNLEGRLSTTIKQPPKKEGI